MRSAAKSSFFVLRSATCAAQSSGDGSAHAHTFTVQPCPPGQFSVAHCGPGSGVRGVRGHAAGDNERGVRGSLSSASTPAVRTGHIHRVINYTGPTKPARDRAPMHPAEPTTGGVVWEVFRALTRAALSGKPWDTSCRRTPSLTCTSPCSSPRHTSPRTNVCRRSSHDIGAHPCSLVPSLHGLAALGTSSSAGSGHPIRPATAV